MFISFFGYIIHYLFNLLDEEFFTLQNEVLTELGGIIQQHLESRNAKSQEILSKLYDQVQRNSELTKKLSKIQSQTNSLHESVMGACMQ